MLDNLFRYFPPDQNYLIEETPPREIDNYLKQILSYPEQPNTESPLWGETASRISRWGTKIGWLPGSLPFIFFESSVLREIANALVARNGQVTAGGNAHYLFAEKLLHELKLPELAERNPFVLSAGETRLVWFLCQWAKLPTWFIISDLTANLSPRKIQDVLAFISRSKEIAQALNLTSPSFIVNYSSPEENWLQKTFNDPNWKRIDISILWKNNKNYTS